MYRVRIVFSILAVLLTATGCQTTTSLNFVPTTSQEATFVEGSTAIKSALPNSTVIMSSAVREIENGSRIDIVVNVNNISSESFVLDTSSISISSPSTGALKVYSYDELVAEEKKRANASMAWAALAGALDTYAASYSGYQTTTGTYSGTTYGSYSGNSYGTYSANTYGTYTGTTYNAAAASQAINAASDRTSSNLQTIQQTSGATLASLRNNILKKTTMEPGMWYGGAVRFEAPALEEDENRWYSLTIRLGKDVHTFELNQNIMK